jgi:hypothetical protein
MNFPEFIGNLQDFFKKINFAEFPQNIYLILKLFCFKFIIFFLKKKILIRIDIEKKKKFFIKIK